MIDQLETIAYCALGNIFGFHPIIGRRIVRELGSAGSFFSLTEKERREIIGPFSGFAATDFRRQYDMAAEELEKLKSEGKSFLALGDERFPESLSHCPDCPMGLFYDSVSGPEDFFTDAPFISIVGTRDLSQYGRDWCRRIVSCFGSCPTKPVIVSGFAIGTDIVAHLAAMDCGLKTIAVLPTGIDSVYPYRHTMIAGRLRSIVGCALITDYPPGTTPKAINFLRRNRIIAGLSRATILIESKARGGGLITAQFAFDYDRELYALPGRIDDPRSSGCNALIASSRARLITDPDMLAQELGLGMTEYRRHLPSAKEVLQLFGGPGNGEDAAAAFERIRDNRGITPDEMAAKGGWPFRKALELAIMLEDKGLIEIDVLQRCSVKSFP